MHHAFGMPFQKLHTKLIEWYAQNRRHLPWREDPTPWHVWISEIMLQQTRVDSVIGYFARFIEHFPTPEALAAADEQELLECWAGLGYYQRARNLQKGAKRVIEAFGGKIPSDFETLQTIPGIGPYTAAAISSIAFDQPVGVVDGNVVRVLTRLKAIDEPQTPALNARLQPLANAFCAFGQASAFNQAMMDLGATVCTPKSPKCDQCPWKADCEAFAQGLQEILPHPKVRPERQKVFVVSGLVIEGESIWLAQRPHHGLLQGLWELPGIENCNDPAQLQELGLTCDPQRSWQITHVFTHREWTLTLYPATGKPYGGQYLEHRLWPISELERCPLGGPALKALIAAQIAVPPRRGAGKQPAFQLPQKAAGDPQMSLFG